MVNLPSMFGEDGKYVGFKKNTCPPFVCSISSTVNYVYWYKIWHGMQMWNFPLKKFRVVWSCKVGNNKLWDHLWNLFPEGLVPDTSAPRSVLGVKRIHPTVIRLYRYRIPKYSDPDPSILQLINGSGSGSCSLRQRLSRCQKKKKKICFLHSTHLH
jgi:hypothetical protein